MDPQMPAPAKTLRFNRFLPFWAVFQADVKLTLSSWIYRAWVALTIGAVVGYLLYDFGAKQESGLVMHADQMIHRVFHWIVLGSVTLIIVLASGTICSERGNVADSILCRGISRYQYFLGKLHSRLTVILGTYLVLAALAITGALFLLDAENLKLSGCLVAMIAVAAFLVLVVTCGVSVSALTSSTLMSIAIVWMCLYGSGFVLSFLPRTYPSPDRAMQMLPHILHGDYDIKYLTRLMSASLTGSFFISLVGLITFSRRDV